MTPELHVTDELVSVAGPLLLEAVERCVAGTGRCRLGVAGGSTPGPTLQWLFERRPAGLWLTWVDERIDGSNQALANARGMSADRVLPMVTGLSLDADLDRFTRSFETEWGGLDVVLLGVGPDGHIASIFPGHPGLEETGIAFTLGDSPKPPAERMSLTLPVLEDVELSVVLARGAGKAATLARAFAADPSLPLGRYRPRAAVHWILDPQAAGELS